MTAFLANLALMAAGIAALAFGLGAGARGHRPESDCGTAACRRESCVGTHAERETGGREHD